MSVGVSSAHFCRSILATSLRSSSCRLLLRRTMGRKSKQAKIGAENRARASAEFEVGQRVLNGGKIAHITGVVYDRSTKAHVYTIRVENDAVQVAPGDLQRVAGTPELFSVGQQVTPAAVRVHHCRL